MNWNQGLLIRLDPRSSCDAYPYNAEEGRQMKGMAKQKKLLIRDLLIAPKGSCGMCAADEVSVLWIRIQRIELMHTFVRFQRMEMGNAHGQEYCSRSSVWSELYCAAVVTVLQTSLTVHDMNKRIFILTLESSCSLQWGDSKFSVGDDAVAVLQFSTIIGWISEPIT